MKSRADNTALGEAKGEILTTDAGTLGFFLGYQGMAMPHKDETPRPDRNALRGKQKNGCWKENIKR